MSASAKHHVPTYRCVDLIASGSVVRPRITGRQPLPTFRHLNPRRLVAPALVITH